MCLSKSTRGPLHSGKILSGYLNFHYKELYLTSEQLMVRGHYKLRRGRNSRLADVVQNTARRVAALSHLMDARAAAETNFALGSVTMSGVVVVPVPVESSSDPSNPPDDDALAAVSRACRTLAPEMNAEEVTQTMWGYKRIKARTAAEAGGGGGGGGGINRRDYEAVMDRAAEVAETMTAAQVARVIRCWGDMVKPVAKRRRRRKKHQRSRGGDEENDDDDEENDDDNDDDDDDDDDFNDEDHFIDDDWIPPTRESLQARLDLLSAAAERTAPEMDQMDFKNLILGWANLAAETHPPGGVGWWCKL